jgi:hypothetical protein
MAISFAILHIAVFRSGAIDFWRLAFSVQQAELVAGCLQYRI